MCYLPLLYNHLCSWETWTNETCRRYVILFVHEKHFSLPSDAHLEWSPNSSTFIWYVLTFASSSRENASYVGNHCIFWSSHEKLRTVVEVHIFVINCVHILDNSFLASCILEIKIYMLVVLFSHCFINFILLFVSAETDSAVEYMMLRQLFRALSPILKLCLTLMLMYMVRLLLLDQVLLRWMTCLTTEMI